MVEKIGDVSWQEQRCVLVCDLDLLKLVPVWYCVFMLNNSSHDENVTVAQNWMRSCIRLLSPCHGA